MFQATANASELEGSKTSAGFIHEYAVKGPSERLACSLTVGPLVSDSPPRSNRVRASRQAHCSVLKERPGQQKRRVRRASGERSNLVTLPSGAFKRLPFSSYYAPRGASANVLLATEHRR